MSTASFILTADFPVHPDILSQAWLSSAEHSAFTGSEAIIDPRIGGRFTAWDEYIEGTTLDFEPGISIRQSWRTTDFLETDPDSILELWFTETPTGTHLKLIHSGYPAHQEKAYIDGWEKFYFEPMLRYFQGL